MGGFLSRVVPPEWMDGYDDASNGRPPQTMPSERAQKDYDFGYKAGAEDREEVNREHSSNT